MIVKEYQMIFSYCNGIKWLVYLSEICIQEIILSYGSQTLPIYYMICIYLILRLFILVHIFESNSSKYWISKICHNFVNRDCLKRLNDTCSCSCLLWLKINLFIPNFFIIIISMSILWFLSFFRKTFSSVIIHINHYELE